MNYNKFSFVYGKYKLKGNHLSITVNAEDNKLVTSCSIKTADISLALKGIETQNKSIDDDKGNDGINEKSIKLVSLHDFESSKNIEPWLFPKRIFYFPFFLSLATPIGQIFV